MALDLTFLFQLAPMFLIDGVRLNFSHTNLSISTFAFTGLLLLKEIFASFVFASDLSQIILMFISFDK